MKTRSLVKTILITGLALTVLYFGGGAIAYGAVSAVVFSRREVNEDIAYIYKVRSDYPALSTRSEHSFLSGNNTLRGYLYSAFSPKGLVLAVHGMGSNSDSDDAQYQQWFLDQGYDVFALDLTCCGNSGGSSFKSLAQSAYDVASCFDYLTSHNLMKDQFIMVGHSWGGYGIAASLQLGVKADKVITFSAFDIPLDTMMEYARSYAGGIADFSYPSFALDSYIVQGKDASLSAFDGLKVSNTKALVIHGEEDNSVKIDGNSLYRRAKDLPNVTTLTLSNVGHAGPWRSTISLDYVKEVVEPKLKERSEDKKFFLASIDKEKTSQLSDQVFSKITSFLAE